MVESSKNGHFRLKLDPDETQATMAQVLRDNVFFFSMIVL